MAVSSDIVLYARAFVGAGIDGGFAAAGDGHVGSGDLTWVLDEEEEEHTTFRSVRSAAPFMFSSVVVPGCSMVAASVTDGVATLNVMARRAIPGPDTQVMTGPRSRGSTFSTSVPPSSPSDSWALLVE